MDGKRRRPLGIWMIVGLELLNGAIWLTDLFLGTAINDIAFQNALADSQPIRGFVFTWGFLVILASVLLWRLSRRGWALMMVLVGISLAANLIVWWRTPESASWASMAVSVATAFYLNSAAVRSLFQERHEVPRITLSDRGAP